MNKLIVAAIVLAATQQAVAQNRYDVVQQNRQYIPRVLHGYTINQYRTNQLYPVQSVRIREYPYYHQDIFFFQYRDLFIFSNKGSYRYAK